jgi:uncharacterized protein YndB with AHSA1/START domain
MGVDTDRIQKRVVLKAPIERVWRAVSDSSQFGEWFGVQFSGPFVVGQAIKGKIFPTKADPEVAKAQEPYSGAAFDCVVDRIEPMKLFSFRWHPFAVEAGVDYSKEPMTLVTFELEAVAGGTQLTITESGFDSLPASRRAKAFEMNEQGWTSQSRLIERYLAHAS